MVTNIKTIVYIALVVPLYTGIISASENLFSRDVAPFIQKHCIECHGPDLQKAKLRLDTLKPEFAEKDSAELWIKALDKITAGQMPPASETRPTPAEIKAATASLSRQLHDASLAKQRQDGRVLLRRLNRTEYENTLRDLLSVHTEFAELLPDDNIAAGFDNVSTALDLSSAHFLRYQDAADRALADADPGRIPKPFKMTNTGKELASKKDSPFKANLDKWVTVRGDDVIVWLHLPFYSNMISYPYAAQPGTYRLKLVASAINNGGKSMPVVISRQREGSRVEAEPLGVKDVASDKPTEIVFEYEMRPRERLHVDGWTLPSESEFNSITKRNVLPEGYAGPGLAIHSIELEGPINPSPGVGYRTLFGDLPQKTKSQLKAELDKKPAPKFNPYRNPDEWLRDPQLAVSANPKADSEKLLRSFLPLAFRRPVDDATTQYFQQFALERMEKNYAFGEAMLAAYKAALCSPHFLILREPVGKLDGYALAARLSYFIWRTMPDTELIALAKDDSLLKPDILHQQLDRLLNDPRAQRFVEDFTGQWLDLRKIDSTSPDPQLYAEFDRYLLWSMPQETEQFFAEMVRHDLSVTQIIDSDWTYVNDRLAQHYGFKNVGGSEMRKVAIPPDSHRGGILTQASVLKVTADGTRTSPILRGKWILDRIIGKPPAPPPPDVPTIEPDIRGATTIRQQLEKHRTTPACNACHKYIDPPGFALETYDVIGGWRDFYRISKYTKNKVELTNYPGKIVGKGLNVEKGDKTPDGRVFKDIADYKKILLEDKDQLARNVIQKLMIFGTGAQIQFADREVVESILEASRKSDFGLRTILHEIVGSRVFLNK